MRKAQIRKHDTTASWLTQDENGYHFVYDAEFLDNKSATSVILTLPLQKEVYTSKVLFPFFDGLIPDGWLLNVAERNWKLNPRDRMGLLLACFKHCIGAVNVHPLNEIEE